VLAFCLMPNHFHRALWPAREGRKEDAAHIRYESHPLLAPIARQAPPAGELV
jgi:hypothetical protein